MLGTIHLFASLKKVQKMEKLGKVICNELVFLKNNSSLAYQQKVIIILHYFGP